MRGLCGYNGGLDSAAPATEIDVLKAALAERDRVIETLRFEIAQLKRLIFGARSERLQAVLDGEQLPLLEQMPEDAPLATPIQFKAAPAASNKGQAKRTALPAHLPREINVIPLAAEERACPGAAKPQPRCSA